MLEDPDFTLALKDFEAPWCAIHLRTVFKHLIVYMRNCHGLLVDAVILMVGWAQGACFGKLVFSI